MENIGRTVVVPDYGDCLTGILLYFVLAVEPVDSFVVLIVQNQFCAGLQAVERTLLDVLGLRFGHDFAMRPRRRARAIPDFASNRHGLQVVLRDPSGIDWTSGDGDDGHHGEHPYG